MLFIELQGGTPRSQVGSGWQTRLQAKSREVVYGYDFDHDLPPLL